MVHSSTTVAGSDRIVPKTVDFPDPDAAYVNIALTPSRIAPVAMPETYGFSAKFRNC
jgi:hypothetical protein